MRILAGWIGTLLAASVLVGWIAACEDDPHDLDYLHDAGEQDHDAGDHDDDAG